MLSWLRCAIEFVALQCSVTELEHGRPPFQTHVGDMVEQRKLQIDARKGMLGKALPKLYGDKPTAELTGKDGQPLQPITDIRELAREFAFILNCGVKDLADKEASSTQHRAGRASHCQTLHRPAGLSGSRMPSRISAAMAAHRGTT